MSSKKTSFKQLLAKGASNPRVNVQSVRDQRDRLDSLKRGAPTAGAAQPPSKRPAVAPPAAPALPAPSSSSSRPASSFVPAPTFAGKRPGFVYKSGPRGVGYYAEGAAAAAASEPQGASMPFATKPSFAAIAAAEEAEEEEGAEVEAQAASEDAAAVPGAAALPTDFFDNPQKDPANRAKAKEMASTHKEQQMRDEMEEFQKSVAPDLKAADAADAVDEEDDVDAAAREEAYVEHDLKQRVGQLKERRAEALARLPVVAAGGGDVGAAAPAAAGAGAEEEEGDDDDDDDDDIDLQAALDWRAKAF